MAHFLQEVILRCCGIFGTMEDNVSEEAIRQGPITVVHLRKEVRHEKGPTGKEERKIKSSKSTTAIHIYETTKKTKKTPQRNKQQPKHLSMQSPSKQFFCLTLACYMVLINIH